MGLGRTRPLEFCKPCCAVSEVRGPERAVVKGMTWFNDILNVFGGGGGGGWGEWGGGA